MEVKFLIILLAAVIPTITGFIWYNPKVFGKAWMDAAGITEEKMKGANMPVIFIVSFILSFLLSFEMQFVTIHQWGYFSILMNEPGLNDPNSEVGMMVSDFMAKYGNNFRTFKHGALHGTVASLLFVLPILGTNALFERKGFKYIAVNCGYWLVTLALMGGVICQFS